MSFSHLLQLKPFLMVLTAAVGTVSGGVILSSYSNKDPGTFLLSLNPSIISIIENASSTSSITITSVNGFTGTVTLSLSYLGTRITASVSPTSVTVAANGVAKSTLTVTAPSTPGNYTIVVTGIASIHSRTTYSSAMLRVQVETSQDFTIVSSPGTITVTTGSTNTTTITMTSVNGYSGNVSLTAIVPFGYITVTGGQNPLRMISGGAVSTSLTITTSTITVPGTYTITVTGTSGSRSHSTSVTVIVVDPTPPPVIVENLSMIGKTFNNGTSLTLTLQNTGNGTVALQSYVIRDTSGDAWSLTNWAGPTIQVNSAGSANILIGSSCPSCIYIGITGLFFQFIHGQTYTITVTTTRNSQFTFTVMA